MKKFILMILLLPILGYSQGNYSIAAKKLFKDAQSEHENGNSAEAIVLYKKCIDEESTFSEAYLNIAIIDCFITQSLVFK